MKIIILSEDASTSSAEVLTNIVKKSMRQIDSRIAPQLENGKVEFDKDSNDPEVVNANKWKAPKEPYKTKTRKFMLNLLDELIDIEGEEKTFVFWHVDGDSAWSKRSKEGGENRKEFMKLIADAAKTMSEFNTVHSINLSKIFLVMPYYSMESWLLPFVDQLTPSSNKKQKKREEEIMTISLEEFDEIEKIKEKHNINENLTLSQKFKHKKLYAVGKSYKLFFDSINGNESFVSELKELLPEWARY